MLAVIAAIIACDRALSPTDQATGQNMVVVLPFGTADSVSDYLGDAFRDDLATDLSRLPGITVFDRDSVFAASRASRDEQNWKRLGARFLVRGKLTGTDTSPSADAELVDLNDGRPVWRGILDSQEDRSQTQAHLSQAIINSLPGTQPSPGWRSSADRKVGAQALDRFLRARSLLREPSASNRSQAESQLAAALTTDPEFLEALDLLSTLLLDQAGEDAEAGIETTRDVDARLRADRLTARALAIQPNDPVARMNHGRVLIASGRYPEGCASLQTSLASLPSDPPVRDWLARCLSRLGRSDDAIRLLEEAGRLDPIGRRSAQRRHHLAFEYLLAGMPNAAAAALAGVDPNDPEQAEQDQLTRIATLVQTGRLEDARDGYREFAKRMPNRSRWRVACAMSRAQAHQPGASSFLDALVLAGMPERADDRSTTTGREPAVKPRAPSGFEKPPATAPGAKPVEITEIESWLVRTKNPLILDVGCGAAVPRDALHLADLEEAAERGDDVSGTLRLAIAGRTGNDAPFLVLGSGPFGWGAYNVVTLLVQMGFRNVHWFRGGEEFWEALHLPTDDRRDP